MYCLMCSSSPAKSENVSANSLWGKAFSSPGKTTCISKLPPVRQKPTLSQPTPNKCSKYNKREKLSADKARLILAIDSTRECRMKQTSNSKHQTSKKFDLEDRLANFGEQTILLCQKLPHDIVTQPLIAQIVRSSTSIGANYAEANNSISRKEYRSKLYIAKKEAQETKHWIRMLLTATPGFKTQLDTLFQENHEICLILQSIANKLKFEPGLD